MKRSGRKTKLKIWAKKSRQKGGFIFMGLAAIGSAIFAAMSAAAPAVATGAITAAAGYATTKALQGTFGKGRKRVGIQRKTRRH